MQNMHAAIATVKADPSAIDRYGYMSTGEWLILCLGVGTKDSIAKLPPNYPTIADAWQRIGVSGQQIVTDAWAGE